MWVQENFRRKVEAQNLAKAVTTLGFERHLWLLYRPDIICIPQNELINYFSTKKSSLSDYAGYIIEHYSVLILCNFVHEFRARISRLAI